MEFFYKHDEAIHNFSAAREIMPYLIKMFSPRTMLDVGCGIGTWMVVAKELGIQEVLGIDGSYVDRDILKINSREFLEQDLRHEFNLGRKFDIALCLEVAEHLPASSAGGLIKSLSNHSDIIVFSAAIPDQGGQNHLNEQWPAYWANLFQKQGFECRDIFRNIFWDNEKIEFWYRQNILLFTKNSSLNFNLPNSLVHPVLFQAAISEIENLRNEIVRIKKRPGIKEAFQLLHTAIRNKFIS
jgi:SAM-dependent methyltransferase